MISRNDPCWCKSGLKWKKCHYPTLSPQKNLEESYRKKYGIRIKTPKQISGIRHACQLAKEILRKTCAMAKAGVTTNELNAYAHQLHIDAGAQPAPLGYGDPPFPKSICTSLNDVICHGIPDDTPLKRGDILNIDVSPVLGGYYGDCSAMVAVGPIDEEKQKVMDVAYQCLMHAIAKLQPGLPICKIGEIIESYAELHNCSVVNQFVGHGVGTHFHEPPEVPHHRNHITTPLAPGMTFTIEPMINAGKREGYIDEINRWTARTIDGKPSAQWEHTVLITETSFEILTN